MSVQRKTISFAQQVAIDRRGNPYIYGGNWDAFKRAVGTDCSGSLVDMLDAAINGTAMAWTRHNLSTENWRPPSMGGSADPNNGPFGTVMCNDPTQFPSGAAILIAFHHGPGGGANSHTWCQVDKLKVETNGTSGTVLFDGANFLDTVLDVHTVDSASTYGANNWWYLPGPLIEDGTPVPVGPSGTVPIAAPTLLEAPDTIYPDVSQYQAPVDDSFLSATYQESGQSFQYRWICIRSNDGDVVDVNFAPNYAWCKKQLDAGNLDGVIVYYYWRPDGSGLSNHMHLVNAQGGPHPKMVSMMDVESGDGNGSANVSNELNTEWSTLTGWLANPSRVIGYGNASDLASMWPSQPAGFMVSAAGYGSNPNLPNQIAHQYTNGQGYGGGLPEGVTPFGNCDMNSADGYTPSRLAIALGISSTPAPSPPAPPAPSIFTPPTGDAALLLLLEQMMGVFDAGSGQFDGWGQLSGDAAALAALQAKVNAGAELYVVDALACIRWDIKPQTTGT